MKKHYMCTHSFISEESRKTFFEATGRLTDREFLTGSANDPFQSNEAEMIQHWMGKDDFFFCHWLATDEDAIFATLEQYGLNDLIVTLPHQTQRYIHKDQLTDQVMVNPFSFKNNETA